MSVWTALTTIAVAGCLTGVLVRYLNTRGQSRTDEPRLDELEREQRELRSRVETLEAIVTDQREDLKRTIEGLDQ